MDHLLESEVEILDIDDDQLTARVIEGEVTYDLATGAGTEVDGVEPTDPLVSPDGAWRIDESTPLREVLVPESGDEVVPDTGTDRWGLVSACAESLRTGSAATDAVATLLRSSATDYERTDERVQSGFRGLLPG